MFLHPFTFNLQVSSCLNWVSCKQHVDGFFFLFILSPYVFWLVECLVHLHFSFIWDKFLCLFILSASLCLFLCVKKVNYVLNSWKWWLYEEADLECPTVLCPLFTSGEYPLCVAVCSLLLCLSLFLSVQLCALTLCLLWAVFALCGVSGTQAG